ncbi:hypothetical protein [Streptomyces sp. WAC 06783]|uniref:hypothetical protein n=1 Tax=Streptomyces sp. WAC 06783 TaxID=2203211 RepID=UPI00163D079C|nr:hypothetical protein [Streptomyces sp. WAC 06783]
MSRNRQRRPLLSLHLALDGHPKIIRGIIALVITVAIVAIVVVAAALGVTVELPLGK